MNPDFSFTLNSMLVKMKNIGNAMVNGYKEAVKLKPEDSSEVYRRMGTTFFNKGDAPQAIAALEKALELNPGDVEILHKLGRSYQSVGKKKEALEKYQQVLALQPDNAKEMVYAAKLLMDDDLAAAIVLLKKAVALEPQTATIHYHLGAAYDKLKDYDNAIAAFEKAIELKPESAKYHFSLGFTYDTKGDHKKAIDSFKRAIAVEKE